MEKINKQKLNVKYYSIIGEDDNIKKIDEINKGLKKLSQGEYKLDLLITVDNNYLLEKIIKINDEIYFGLHKIQYDNFPKKGSINKGTVSDVISLKLNDKDVLLHPFYVSLSFKDYDFNYKGKERKLKGIFQVAKKGVDLPNDMLPSLLGILNILFLMSNDINIKGEKKLFFDGLDVEKFNEKRDKLDSYLTKTDVKIILNKQGYTDFVSKGKSYKEIDITFSEKAKEITGIFSFLSNVFKSYGAMQIRISIKAKRGTKSEDSYLKENKVVTLLRNIKEGKIEGIEKGEIKFYDSSNKPSILELLDYIEKNSIYVDINNDGTINKDSVIKNMSLDLNKNIEKVLKLITN